MNPANFVRDSVYNKAMKQGAVDRVARDHADEARDAYLKNKFAKPSELIEERVKAAVKDSKKEKK